MDEHNDTYQVMISIDPPTMMRSRMSAVEIIMEGRVTFNGHTATVTEFLSACMPYLDEIAASLDGIRTMRMVDGHEFAKVELEYTGKDGAATGAPKGAGDGEP